MTLTEIVEAIGIEPFYRDPDGDGVIYCGDCREILPLIPDGAVDLVLTDPPYGIGYASSHVGATTTAPWMNQEIAGDCDCSLRDAVLSRFTEWACFGSHKSSSPGQLRGHLIWDKGPESGMGDLSWPWKLSWELIFLRGSNWYGRRDEGIIKGFHIVTRKNMGRQHPNQKPVNLVMYLLRKHSGKTIFDPFLGSGTTAVAAKKLGRKYIGIEINPDYCKIAERRLQNLQPEFQFKERIGDDNT